MSRMELGHEEVKELIASYVLDAVPAEEVPWIRAHILSCDECMAEADNYAEVVADLGLAADPVPLPKGFEDRVMALATQEGPATEAPVVQLPKRTRWIGTALGTAAAVVIAFLTFSLFDTRSELNDERTRSQELQQAVTSILHSSDEGMELRGDGAVARMIPSNGGSVLALTGLREAPANHDYQLWLIRDGEPVSAGVFDISDGVALIESDHSLEGFEAAAITIEPDGGSPGPTTDPVMTAG